MAPPAPPPRDKDVPTVLAFLGKPTSSTALLLAATAVLHGGISPEQAEGAPALTSVIGCATILLLFYAVPQLYLWCRQLWLTLDAKAEQLSPHLRINNILVPSIAVVDADYLEYLARSDQWREMREISVLVCCLFMNVHTTMLLMEGRPGCTYTAYFTRFLLAGIVLAFLCGRKLSKGFEPKAQYIWPISFLRLLAVAVPFSFLGKELESCMDLVGERAPALAIVFNAAGDSLAMNFCCPVGIRYLWVALPVTWVAVMFKTYWTIGDIGRFKLEPYWCIWGLAGLPAMCACCGLYAVRYWMAQRSMLAYLELRAASDSR